MIFQSGAGGLIAGLPDGTGAYTLDAGVDATPAYSRDGGYVFAATTPSPGAQSRLEYTPSSWNITDHHGSGDMKPWFASATGGSDRFLPLAEHQRGRLRARRERTLGPVDGPGLALRQAAHHRRRPAGRLAGRRQDRLRAPRARLRPAVRPGRRRFGQRPPADDERRQP
ncbi:hypothetical protein ACFQZC_03085 [Streptacidiphilus monticola]